MLHKFKMNKKGQIRKVGIIVLMVGIILIGIINAGWLSDLFTGDDSITLNDGTNNITFTWTDDNTDEELLMYSDKKIYSSETNTIIRYLAIENTNSKNEKAYLKSAYEQNKGLENSAVYLWDKTKWVIKTKEIVDIEVINQSYDIYESVEVSCKDYNLTKGLDGKCYISNLIDTYEFETDKYEDLEKSLLDTKDVKDYIAKEKFEINLVVGMNYIMIDTGVPIGYEGEFFDEVFGEYGSYGHLDPYIQFSPPTLDDLTLTLNNWSAINITINETNLETMIYNWNGTNFTFYNDSLVGMWNFDAYTLATDTSSSGNDGSITGATFGATTGKYNGAYYFDGGDYITMTENTDLYFNKNFSYSYWMKPDSSQNSLSPVVGKADNQAYDISYLNYFNAGKLYNAIGYGGGSRTLYDTGFTLAEMQSKWNFITVTINDTHTTLYRNGIPSTSTAISSSAIHDSTHNFIVGFAYGWSGKFKGYVDEVRIWNRTLTHEQINQSYMSNFRKYSSENWSLYVNQTESPGVGLADGAYTYQGWAEDTGNAWNTTGERTVCVGVSCVDTTPPTYSNGLFNQTYGGLLTRVSLDVDDTLLETKGQYTFSTNNTGVWTNQSAINFTSTPQTITYDFVLNDTIGNIVCFSAYVSDNLSNENFTAINYCTTVISQLDTQLHKWWFNNATGMFQVMHINRSVDFDLELWFDGNVTATTDVCVGAICLSNAFTGSELDPFWSSNYTSYNSSWSSIFNQTYEDAYQYTTNDTFRLLDNHTFNGDVNISGNLNMSDSNITDVNILSFIYEEFIDNLVDGWLRITGNLNVTGNVEFSGDANITGDLNTDGNFTGNQIYGGMWGHNHTATEFTFVDGVYAPIPMINATHLNGFTHEEDGILIGSNLTTQVAGVYQITYMASGSGQNNHTYYTSIFCNEVNQDNCENHKKMAAGGDIVTQSGNCLIELAVGDKVSMRTADIGGSGSGNYYSANLNLVRIGD